MADDGPQNQQVPRQSKMLVHLPVMAKVLEVILAVFAIGLIVDPLNSFQEVFNKPRFKLDDAAVVYVSVAGYIMINTLFIICHVVGDRIPKRTLIMFAAMGALMHIVAGSVLVHDWRKIHGPHYRIFNNELYPSKQYMDMLISGAVFTFLTALAFVIEVFLSIKYSTKEV